MNGISTLLIRTEELDELIQPLRMEYTPSGPKGMPAHITALHPFKNIDDISPEVMATLRRTLFGVQQFDFELSRIAMFNDAVMFLEPSPAEPFIRITEALVEAFPDNLPYGGEYGDIVPHLTIAHIPDEKSRSWLNGYLVSRMKEVKSAKLRVECVWLYLKSEGRLWEPGEALPLGK